MSRSDKELDKLGVPVDIYRNTMKEIQGYNIPEQFSSVKENKNILELYFENVPLEDLAYTLEKNVVNFVSKREDGEKNSFFSYSIPEDLSLQEILYEDKFVKIIMSQKDKFL
jgi:hypothetical protein|tara:strand:- start:5082 stop:5417 length:336 start_codon:yes stop_codon:yes gene_type:complete